MHQSSVKCWAAVTTQALWSFMTKGEPHFPRVRPGDPMVAPEYIKPFGLISKAKWYQGIYKTKDVGAMWRVAAGICHLFAGVGGLLPCRSADVV